MNPVVLVDHRHDCPKHRIGVVKTGSADYAFNGKAVARVGGRISSGEVITDGSAGYLIKGTAVACEGDQTIHDGGRHYWPHRGQARP
ncbi:PAAR domain-containing protein [Pseudomonas sp. NPDC089743]|uniref:PAAR domain-containing protein n=1 Tax=Pseudomonas TaxID=286 RepID=UPI001F52304C|nr:PAAR domain-containing protein [Pseudomonas putida]MCI0912699.1 PAAR domain-containing protein [Pseudomonas putida]